jgi:hypothetical protein
MRKAALLVLVILFLSNHTVNQDDRLLLARAMASDFSVAWQFSQIEHFLLRIKLHALIRLGVSLPLFDIVRKVLLTQRNILVTS